MLKYSPHCLGIRINIEKLMQDACSIRQAPAGTICVAPLLLSVRLRADLDAGVVSQAWAGPMSCSGPVPGPVCSTGGWGPLSVP